MVEDGSSILITGGTGFLGKSILDHLYELSTHEKHFNVTVLSRSPELLFSTHAHLRQTTWLRFIVGDLNNFESEDRYDYIIHAAADTHSMYEKGRWAAQIVDGTRKMIAFARKSNTKKLLLVSSGAVYGNPPADMVPIEEDCSWAPNPTSMESVYGNAKRYAETLCAIESFEGKVSCVSARCFAMLSPYIPLNGPYAAGNFIRDALDASTRAITVRGDGSAVRSYIDGRDLATWILKLLAEGKAGTAYNVGGNQPVTVKQLAHMISDVSKTNKPVVVESSLIAARSNYYPSLKLAYEIGLTHRYSLEDTVRHAIERIRMCTKHCQ